MRSSFPAPASALAVLLLASGFAAGTAAAQTPAGKAVEVRQAGFKQIGAAFKGIGDELKRGKPDLARVAAASERLQTHAAQLPSWFPKGSGAEAGVKTAARPEIWTDAAGFADAASRLRVETAALHKAAVGGDLAVVRQRAKATGQACAACHTGYREED